MSFLLHPNLAKKIFVGKLPLCTLLLEDNAHYPWLILVPRRADVSRTIDLSPEDQHQLFLEGQQIQHLLWELFQPTQLNIAAIGNKTPQLHLHVIARSAGDPAWPGTVWDHPTTTPYSATEKTHRLTQLRKALVEINMHIDDSAY